MELPDRDTARRMLASLCEVSCTSHSIVTSFVPKPMARVFVNAIRLTVKSMFAVEANPASTRSLRATSNR
jgi:hypothetical protein